MRELRRPELRLIFAILACALILAQVPFAVGFSLWLAFGPPPRTDLAPAPAREPLHVQRGRVMAAVSELVA